MSHRAQTNLGAKIQPRAEATGAGDAAAGAETSAAGSAVPLSGGVAGGLSRFSSDENGTVPLRPPAAVGQAPPTEAALVGSAEPNKAVSPRFAS